MMMRADLAQLVEQLIRNEQVVGSSPIISSIVHSRLPVTGGLFLQKLGRTAGFFPDGEEKNEETKHGCCGRF